MNSELKHIPTNIITGFLGVGKTTAILHLLKHKPEDEIWAVLVNEFGQIGLDGEIIQNQDAVVKEVPGGCMCCAAGVNMKVGLNALVKQARPDRLLIEPTGIGHPQQILKILSEPPYCDLLSMQACICLLDPRNLQDDRYLNNDNFNQQIAVADVLIANKTDQCTENDQRVFNQLIQNRNKHHMGWIQHGRLDPGLLEFKHRYSKTPCTPAHHHFLHKAFADEIDITLQPDETYRRLDNEEDGYFSCGWLFSDQIFEFDKLIHLFNQQTVNYANIERIKAAVLTNQEDWFINCVRQDMSLHQLYNLQTSRIEIISSGTVNWQILENQLLECLLT